MQHRSEWRTDRGAHELPYAISPRSIFSYYFYRLHLPCTCSINASNILHLFTPELSSGTTTWRRSSETRHATNAQPGWVIQSEPSLFSLKMRRTYTCNASLQFFDSSVEQAHISRTYQSGSIKEDGCTVGWLWIVLRPVVGKPDPRSNCLTCFELDPSQGHRMPSGSVMFLFAIQYLMLTSA